MKREMKAESTVVPPMRRARMSCSLRIVRPDCAVILIDGEKGSVKMRSGMNLLYPV
jgi:hypothetical protein